MKLMLKEKIPGYEQEVEFCEVYGGDECLNSKGGVAVSCGTFIGLKLTPEKRIIDWNKVSGEVLVHSRYMHGLYQLENCDMPRKIYKEPQVHTGLEVCPVDPRACWVVTNDGQEGYGEDINWSRVYNYRVVKCNYE